MKFSKKTELLLLFAVLFFFINFLYYTYVYSYLQKKKQEVSNQIIGVNNSINTELLKYNSSMNIFNKIKSIKSEIRETEDKLILLKTKVKTDIQISDIIKSLIKESGINLHDLSLKDKKTEGNNFVYTFDVAVSGKLENLVRLVDKIDNKNELLKINSYNIKKEENNYKMKIIISSIYQGLNK
jgi:ACT domain-containing protein